jgi:mannose-6-phosphate isomerase-like protein (cupin superfamily)
MGRPLLSAGRGRDLSEGVIAVDVVNLDRVSPFTTKDGSEIRELLAHRNSSIRNQTLAEARLPAGGRTEPHHHMATEEIYFVLEGEGLMRVGRESAVVRPGDAIAIPPGASHQIANTGPGRLRFLCCCAPGYEHADTILERGSDDRA